MPAAAPPGTTLAALRQGRALYIAKCSGCHALHLPSEHTPQAWRRSLDEMQARARISDPEKEIILRYILSARRER